MQVFKNLFTIVFVKAKDLKGKNIEDLQEDSYSQRDSEPKKEDEDKVAAAYENISKKLESIRSGKTPEDEEEGNEAAEGRSDEEDKSDELEEWKGPKGVKSEEGEGEEEEHDLRKVNLKNLEDEDKEQTEELEEKDGEEGEKLSSDAAMQQKEEEDKSEELEAADKKEWKPKENDPLDEESDKSEDSEDSESQKIRELEGQSSIESDKEKSGQSETPDTLDDLTEDRPQRRVEEEDEYFIPNLKGSGQRCVSMEYNTPIERERSGESYQKSSMDTNDPNNFFSQHNQPQAPKRASKFHLLILVIIGIVVIGFTVYILKGGFGDLSLTTKSSPSPSPVENPSSTPTPTPKPDRAQYKLRVLNGSGKTGLAASVSAKLKDLGYQTDKTGNATNSAFAQTIVRVKSSLESFIPQIVKDLAPDFDAAGNSSLKDSDTVDIEVILGAR